MVGLRTRRHLFLVFSEPRSLPLESGNDPNGNDYKELNYKDIVKTVFHSIIISFTLDKAENFALLPSESL